MKKTTINVLAVIFSVLVALSIWGGLYYVGTIKTDTSSDVEFKNLVIERPTYVKSCSYWAKQEIGTDGLTDEQINTYCGCVYDKGVALYGNEKFIAEDKKLGETGIVTAEFNTIVNDCIQVAL